MPRFSRWRAGKREFLGASVNHAVEFEFVGRREGFHFTGKLSGSGSEVGLPDLITFRGADKSLRKGRCNSLPRCIGGHPNLLKALPAAIDTNTSSGLAEAFALALLAFYGVHADSVTRYEP
jgi:hypothetical protein